MSKQIALKNTKILYLYWVAVFVTAAVALIVALTVETARTANVVAAVCLLFNVLFFLSGYVDFKNYKPLSKRQEPLYIATGMLSLSCILFFYNVENYNSLQLIDVVHSYYSPVASAFVALQVGVGFYGVCLALMHGGDKVFQTKVFYAVAAVSLISSAVMIPFNFGTGAILLKGAFGLTGWGGIIVDAGLLTLVVRSLIEYGVFVVRAVKRRRAGAEFESDETEYESRAYIFAAVGFAFMLSDTIVLRFFDLIKNYLKSPSDGLFIAYNVVEIVASAGIIVAGTLMAARCRKSPRYGSIYARMSMVAIICGSVYLLADFVPVSAFFKADAVARDLMITEIYQSAVKIAGLLIYALYVLFNKKLARQIADLGDGREKDFFA